MLKLSSIISQHLTIKLIALVVALFAVVLTSFWGAQQAHAQAASGTFAQETNLNNISKAIKYFSLLRICGIEDSENDRGFKKEISGDDIDKGPRWWMWNSIEGVHIGKNIDQWGDQNGKSNCNGEKDEMPGWINAAFSYLGVKVDGGRASLESLGYKCAIESGTYKCKNDLAREPSSTTGSVLNKLKSLPYLGGTDPTGSSTIKYKAASYLSALGELKTTCGGVKGGSTNIISIKIVDSKTGVIKTESWGMSNPKEEPLFIPFERKKDVYDFNNKPCSDTISSLTSNNAEAYAQWIGMDICRNSFPAQSNNSVFIEACAKGAVNKFDYISCAKAGGTVNTATGGANLQNACFLGQGLPTDSGGKTVGEICYNTLKYTADGLLGACIAGGVNRDNPNYCASNYPVNDNLSANPNKPIVDPNKDRREACLEGAALKLTDTILETATPTDPEDPAATDGTSCGIEGLGWVICPLLGFLGSISDTAFDFLSTSFLETSADYVQVGGPAYNAWVVMRNFANVAFVIVFLIIIFSQLTGYGVTNYGVKKMLPRLVIAAILVNISFFICQVAIDLSNILGYSLKSLFDSIGTLVQPASTVSADATGNGLGIALIVAGVIAGGVTLLFSITVPILLAVVLALLMIVLILLGRTALIILLLIISPLAFVAYLLPNTEDWFKKWYKLFFSLLLLFPIIAVVFGASGLAGKIIYDSAGDDMVRQLMGIGIAVIPLFIVPSLLKGALSATGQLGAKLSGLANKAGGNIGGKYKSTSRLAALNEARRRNAQIRRAQITGGVYTGKNPLSKLSSAASGAFNASRISGTAGTKLAQQSAALANKLDVEDIDAANAQIKQANISDADLKRVAGGEAVKGINGRDGAARAAAMMEQTRRGNFGDLQSSWNGMLGESPAVKRRVAQAFSSFAEKPGFIGQGVLGQLSRSEGVAGEQTLEYLAANGGDRYSAQKVASTSKEELGYLLSQQTTATATNPTGGIQGELIDAANEAFSNPDISGLIGNNRNAIMDIATNPAPRR